MQGTKEILMLPSFDLSRLRGQLRLADLERQADKMTDVLNELRKEGYKKITLEMIVRRLEETDRVTLADFDPSLFTFTGRKVIPCEEKFFAWYSETGEGQQLRDQLDKYCPGAFGHFAKVTINI